MVILAIETSCDDTCVAIYKDKQILCNEIVTFHKSHQKHFGIVPEIASRNHEQVIIKTLKNAILKCHLTFNDINYIAYTSHPGLAGSLHVGKIVALTLANLLNLHLIPVNHIHGHIFSSFIDTNQVIKYPFLSLIASGGTTAIYLVKAINSIEVLNQTQDDSIGDAFDKIGRMLNLNYPGGPEIDKLYDANFIDYQMLPLQKPQKHFSYSGIKTKIKNYIHNLNELSENEVKKIASTFQYWAIKSLTDKIDYYVKKYNISLVCIGGGVSANSLWRSFAANVKQYKIIYPLKQYTVDNAAMIAFYAALLLQHN